MFPCLVSCLIFDVYFFSPLGLWSMSLLVAGDMRGGFFFQRPLNVVFFSTGFYDLIWYQSGRGDTLLRRLWFPSIPICHLLPVSFFYLPLFLVPLVRAGLWLIFLVLALWQSYWFFYFVYICWCPPSELFDLLFSSMCLRFQKGLIGRLFGVIPVSWYYRSELGAVRIMILGLLTLLAGLVRRSLLWIFMPTFFLWIVDMTICINRISLFHILLLSL